MNLNQYHLVWVNLDPTLGSELKKTRPCVILSPNELNLNLKTIIIAPIINTTKAYPTRIKINEHSIQGFIAIDQIKTIDKSRIISSIGSLSNKEIVMIKSIIREVFID